MATVYRVYDEATDRQVALKQQATDASQNPQLSMLFEREFHTLAQLAHPLIIEVYDYGVDNDTPYYTMELLEGADLRKLAPIEWRQTCRLLRDVASSLALLHSRRFLHRDISSRNVRCTQDGRAKLIDFGAMAPFGVPVKVIGTPAFVAPETLNYQPLDQRTDLYALGALAYWLITKRHAYRARHISQLRDAWRSQPPSLASLSPSVPGALNDLVMSLLSLDRMARPFSASEVVEKLTVCAELEPEDTPEVKQSYLATPRLVGRGALITELRKRVFAMYTGQKGETILFEGPCGIGRSRLLAELVLEGKVIGATVLTARAETGARAAYTVVWKLLEQLFESAYDDAIDAITPNIALLERAFPRLSELIALRTSNRTEDNIAREPFSNEIDVVSANCDCIPKEARFRPGTLKRVETIPSAKEERLRVQKVLLDLFLTFSRSRRLIVAIDDIHRADEFSMALLSMLALASCERRLMVVATIEQGAPTSATVALRALSRVARRIEINALEPKAIDKLIQSIFGETPKRVLISDRIFTISKGNPRAVMQLLQHLVDTDVVSYHAGAWTFSSHIDSIDLPADISDAFRNRLEQLSTGALELARTVALVADQRLSFEECLVVSHHRETEQLTRELNELVAAEIFDVDEAYYAFSQPAWISLLHDDADQTRTRQRHQRLAALFSQRYTERLRVVHHLITAGEIDQALDLLVTYVADTLERFGNKPQGFSEYIRSLPKGWEDTFIEALDLSERLGRPKKESHMMRYLFIRSGFSTGSVSRSDIVRVIEHLYSDSGLGIFHELKEPSDERERLSRALELAQQRYDATAESDRVTRPKEAIRQLAGAITAANGHATIGQDYALIASLPSIEALSLLSPTWRITAKHIQASRNYTAGRFERARQVYLELLEIIARPDGVGLDESYRYYIRTAITYAIGLIESVGIDTTLNRADEVESHPLFQINAWWLRFIYYLRQGDNQRAARCKKQLELLQIQNNSSRLFEGGYSLLVLNTYAACDDLTGVVQTIDSIEKMAQLFDGWIPPAHFAHGEYHRIRGDYASALTRLEQALRLTEAGRHVIWPFIAGSCLKILCELGRLHQASELGHDYLQAAERADLGWVKDAILTPLAVIEAKLGNQQRAVALADAAIESLHQLGATGIYLGLAYEARARVAVYADDPKNFRKYAKLCGEQYRIGQHPILTAKHQKLMQDARQAYLGQSQEVKRQGSHTVSLTEGADSSAAFQAHLAQFESRQELIDGALDLMVKRTHSDEAFLYLSHAGQLVLTGQTCGQLPPDRIVEFARIAFSKRMGEDPEREAGETQTDSSAWQNTKSEYQSFEIVVLSAIVDKRPLPVGAVILVIKEPNVYKHDYFLFKAVAQSLYEATRPSTQLSDDDRGVVACESRYELETLIGEGGMASVYRARDRESGRTVAFKRVHVISATTAAHRLDATELSAKKKRREDGLRREYQTLKLLAHPRVVAVYDFGVDQVGAYYTMELLEGTDLEKLAPLDWRKACLLLRELASALALLHSRRLLHRDLSPRNVRLTRDGHIKLLDFGAMTPMGFSNKNVGTPPYIPPEVIYCQPLDQRSDLYSFGALAYWLLTGRHAFRVRSANDLSKAWRKRPEPPSRMVAGRGSVGEIPEAVDQLVMSLLSMDPRARPISMAEVIERLSAIGGHPIDEQLAVPQAYLTTPVLVGRERALLAVRKRVIRAVRRRGKAIVVEGDEGVGLTRFLDACAMEGKLTGLVVLRAEGKDAQLGSYAVVKALVARLLDEIPEIAWETMTPYRAKLEPVLSDLIGFSGRAVDAGPSETSQSEGASSVFSAQQQLRPHIQAALREWMVEISRKVPLMLAVDDLDTIDEPSAAFLALLSHEITNKSVVIVASVHTNTTADLSHAIRLMTEVSTRLALRNLDRKETRELLESLFGGAPNVRLLADRLFSISQGNPSVTLQLSQHLVDASVIRYQAGSWTLPETIHAHDLPAGLVEALKVKLSKLSDEALQLAEVLSLCPEQRLSFDECRIVTRYRDSTQLIRHLDELVAAGIFSTDGKLYALSQQSWASALLSRIDDVRKRDHHLWLADAFERRGNAEFWVIRHLFAAGAKERALDIFVAHAESTRQRHAQNATAYSEYLQSLPRDWVATYEYAINACERLLRPLRHEFTLRYSLLDLGTVTGDVKAEQLARLFAQLHHDAGLDIYHELGDSVEPQERLSRSLQLAQERYEASADSDRVLSPTDAIRELARAVHLTVSIAVTSFDYALVESLPSLAPLVHLSPALGIIDKLVQTVKALLSARSRSAADGYRGILQRLDQPDRAGLDETRHRYLRLGVMYGLGLIESTFGSTAALDYATDIEAEPLHQVNAWRIRMVYYLRQGDIREAMRCKNRSEILRIQNSPSQYYEGTHLYPQLLFYALADDLIGIKQTIDGVGKMASRFDSWKPILYYARGEFQRIRGDYREALGEFERALAISAPGRHVVWPYIALGHQRALFELGQLRESKSAGLDYLQILDQKAIGAFVRSFIQMQLALVETKLGNRDNAANYSERAIERLTNLGPSGLNLGFVNETRARIANAMHDREAFIHYASRCAEQYLTGGSPSLVAKYEKLLQEARKTGLDIALIDDQHIDVCSPFSKEYYREIRLQLERCRDARDRADRALEILTERYGASGGHLFGLQDDGLRLLSSRNTDLMLEQLLSSVSAYLEAELEDSIRASITLADENAAVGKGAVFTHDDKRPFESVLLYGFKSGRLVVTGVAVLTPANGSLKVNDPEVLHAISDALLAKGDVVSRNAVQ